MASRYRELAAAFLPALRNAGWMRPSPPGKNPLFYARAADGVELHCELSGRNPDSAVIVAHPAIVGSRHAQVLELARELERSFSVVTFDFRGHGRSGGRCPLGFGAASRDLEAVVNRVRLLGFDNVGVAGMSLGAAAGFVLLSRGAFFDSFVSIGCPPRFPGLGPASAHPRLSRAALRALGMRVDRSPDDGPDPADVAAGLPPVPKLLFFGEWEVAPPEEVAAFAESVTGPRRIVTVPGVWHADLAGREPLVRQWFEETL